MHYVSTDAAGVEHAADGPVRWALPDGGEPAETVGERLVLREPGALLGVLDERIFEVAPAAAVTPAGEGALATTRARLVRATPWGVETAARFALECAAHVLVGVGDVALPGGITLDGAVADARRALGGDDGTGLDHLDRLAELGALRRLRRDHGKLLASLKLALSEDRERHLDELEDPVFDEVRTVVDAVLAALEALRHWLLPHAYRAFEERREEGEAHEVEGRATDMPVPVPIIIETPWGAGTLGARRVLSYEPAWAAARDAARHARDTARARAGGQAAAARDEQAWQAELLAGLLAPEP